MLNAVVRVNQIDYEKNLHRVFPRVNANIKKVSTDSPFVQRFQSLGSDAEAVATAILAAIPESERTQLVVDGINANADWMTSKFNGKAAKYTGGDIIKLGSVSVENVDGDYVAKCNNISVVYKQLVDIESVKIRLDRLLGGFAGIAKTGVKVAAGIAPEKFEKTIIDLLSKEENKKKLIAYGNSLVQKFGFYANIVDIQLVQIPAETVPQTKVEDKLVVPADIETKLSAAWK